MQGTPRLLFASSPHFFLLRWTASWNHRPRPSVLQAQEVGAIDGIWILFVSLAVVGGFLATLAWAAARARRRGISGSMMGPFDQMWHPAAVESHLELQVEAERKKPLPSPDDL